MYLISIVPWLEANAHKAIHVLQVLIILSLVQQEITRIKLVRAHAYHVQLVNIVTNLPLQLLKLQLKIVELAIIALDQPKLKSLLKLLRKENYAQASFIVQLEL